MTDSRSTGPVSKAGSRRIPVGAGRPAATATATPAGAPGAIRIDLSGATAAAVVRPVTVEPGEYALLVRDVRVVPPVPTKNASLALALHAVDEDGRETRLKTDTLWIWSGAHPGDEQPDLVLEHRALLADILKAAGREAPAELGSLVEALKGAEFTAYVVLKTDRRSGEHCNEIAEVLLPEPEEGA